MTQTRVEYVLFFVTNWNEKVNSLSRDIKIAAFHPIKTSKKADNGNKTCMWIK